MGSLARPDSISSPSRPFRIAPLVRAIAREIRERSRSLLLIEAGVGSPDPRQRSLMEAEASVERRELERATRELECLGCTILAWSPLTVALERRRRRELWMLEGLE